MLLWWQVIMWLFCISIAWVIFSIVYLPESSYFVFWSGQLKFYLLFSFSTCRIGRWQWSKSQQGDEWTLFFRFLSLPMENFGNLFLLDLSGFFLSLVRLQYTLFWVQLVTILVIGSFCLQKVWDPLLELLCLTLCCGAVWCVGWVWRCSSSNSLSTLL